MLCPEIWNFKAPESTSSIHNFVAQPPLKTINNFTYTHLVTVVLPDISRVPQELADTLTSDCDYYKISNLALKELVEKKFLDSFIKSGNLYLLSNKTRLDCDNCVAVTPKGQLILNLDKVTYQSLGLEGVVSHFHTITKERFSAWLAPMTTIRYRKSMAMPRHRGVPTLQTLSLQSVGSLVVSLVPPIVASIKIHSEPQKIAGNLNRSLLWLNQLLASHVPFYLYDDMALQVLNAIKSLVDQTKKTYYYHASVTAFLTEMNVVVNLTEIVLGPQLKQIDFVQWPKIMRYVLYKNLVRMTGLEVLNLGSCTGGWRTVEYDKWILDGITGMKHLKTLCLCFDCTDTVIQAIGDNCPNIQSLDVTSSGCVTDRSIPSLLKCQQLKQLQLHRTSITVDGLAQILIGLPKLQDIGRCNEFGSVIKSLHKTHNASGPFQLRKMQTRSLSTENLRLFVDMFPRIECISLFHDDQISDLTVLTSLDHLSELKLLCCCYNADYVKQLLEVRGGNITSLHLEHVEEINLNIIIDISQFCPYLKSLILYNCDFLDSPSTGTTAQLKVPPFQNLERIFWMVDCAYTHLEFILMHAVNIKNVHLGSSTGITHGSIVKILNQNRMKYLEEMRILYSSDMNMRTVELLLASCSNLKVLSELESWQGITTDELSTFREHISSNNFDLDIRPTLSYY